MPLNPLKSPSLSLSCLTCIYLFFVLIQFSIKCMDNGSLSRSVIRINLRAFLKKKKKNLHVELNKLIINILFLLQNVHYNSYYYYFTIISFHVQSI